MTDVEGNFDTLVDRAEDMLWPQVRRETTWADILDRATSNVRWLWLPRTGLDELRRLAVSRQRWRENGTGGIEKGPFPKERTSVGVTEAGYDEATGTATINVLAKNAGRRPRIFWSTTIDVSSKSNKLDSPTVSTTDMRRYFLAVDPEGDHETGDVFAWANRLNLTHDPKAAGSGYAVDLTVVPSGQIRWNTDATAARDGHIYDGPIKLDGEHDVVIYAYAEANGISTTKEFKIASRVGDGPKIDGARPARARKTVQLATTDKVFAAIAKGKEVRVKFRSVIVTVGSGAKNVSTSFGAEVEVTADSIERLAKLARTELGDDNADVSISWKIADTDRAADLDGFMAAVGESLETGEIEQN